MERTLDFPLAELLIPEMDVSAPNWYKACPSSLKLDIVGSTERAEYHAWHLL